MRHAILHCVAAILMLLASQTPALAHKMKVFATAEGTHISGYAYFNATSRAINAKVTITGSDGSILFQNTTDAAGQFSFTASQRMDHHILVDGNDGHVARFTITAAELPESLPAAVSSTGPVIAASAAAAPSAPPQLGANDPLDAPSLRAFIDQSVARQIRPLREQIEAYQDKIWWHDIIGGVGYIIGIAGFAFGWASRKRHP